MVFDTISGDSASTSTKFGGTALNKIGNWLNGGKYSPLTYFQARGLLTEVLDSMKLIIFGW